MIFRIQIIKSKALRAFTGQPYGHPVKELRKSLFQQFSPCAS